MFRQNIHSEFREIAAFELPFKRPLVQRLLNFGLSLAAWHKFYKYRGMIHRMKISGFDGHQIQAWVIKPETPPLASAALLYFHGGCFVMKHSPQHIENAIRYAREANCHVIFVDYRLSPKHIFPAAFNDGNAALKWTFENAEKLGIDRQRVAIGGDSAGGAIAAAVAQKASKELIKLCGQLLIYPVTDSDCKSPSSFKFADVPPFKQFSVEMMWETYLGHPPRWGVPTFASPLKGELSGLAPVYLETCECDPLHDEGIAYSKALIASNVDLELNDTKGTVHGYDLLAPTSRFSQEAIANRVRFLRKIFAVDAA